MKNLNTVSGIRLDKVVVRLVERLQQSVGDAIPNGTTVVLAVVAPIRVAAKTADALTPTISTLAGRRARRRDEPHMVHGNRIRLRLVRHGVDRAPRLVGFAYSADRDVAVLLDAAEAWLVRP